MQDEDLMRLLAMNEESGLEAIIDRYSAFVMKIIYSKLGDCCSREDMEETASDIFLLFLKSARIRNYEIKSISAFISVIAKRQCVNAFRKSISHEQTVSYDEVENVVSDVEQIDFERMRLLNAIKQLGETDEEIFVRKYYLGQKSREIAKDMGIKTNTIDKRISRGLKKLKTMLEEDL